MSVQMLLLFGTHLYFTFFLHLIQRKLPEGIAGSFSGKNQSSYAALATALAATIGTGNIIGVAAAVIVGGPGAVFWCWLTGLLGIATCYAECFLSVKYRVKKENGTYVGGPMYVLEHGLQKKRLAVLFSVFTVLASFGIGSSVQSNAISAAVRELTSNSSYFSGNGMRSAGFFPHLVGICVGLLAGKVILGGSRQISNVCMWLVPLMSVLYLGGCLFLIGKNRGVLAETLGLILRSAFVPRAAAGGISGTMLARCIQTGIARGLFTNEAGLGSIPIAAAQAQNISPQKQALVSMTGPFWDTVVMCAVTGIAIVSSMVRQPERYDGISGERLCFAVFEELPFGGEKLLAVSLILFAFATILGWNVYGESAVRYLWGSAGVKVYQIVYMLFVYLGAVLSMETVWGAADFFNSLMALPNLFCLWMLRKEIR